jgi:hypothetical protein
MGKNNNSFAETVQNLVDSTNVALESLVSINKSLTTQSDTVNMSVQTRNELTGDVSTSVYAIPSYTSVLNKLDSVYNTVDVFVKGQGMILLEDGTYRQISTQPIAIPPDKILNVIKPTKFKTKSNWFFESLLFPQLAVTFDLKGKIDDASDRVLVKRIIFDNPTSTDTQWFLDNVANKELSYYDTITLLNTNNRKFWEDEEIQTLPLYAQPYTGYFVIMNIAVIDNKEWFYLDDIKYAPTTDTPLIKNMQLSKGDQLRYNNSIWKVEDIEVTEKRVKLTPIIGLDYPSINNQFNIYTTPFSSKLIDIPIGYNECDSIFIKGVNDYFNIVGSSWSNAISFWTNDLVLENSVDKLDVYYNNFVSDFGMQLEGQAKEKFIPAYFGVTPDAPVFSAANFGVSQINSQLNAALNTDSIRNTQIQIESTKTIINSLKNTIAQQKADLVEETRSSARLDLNNKISENIKSLSSSTVEYQSLVRSLSTAAYENSAVISNPKYRIRGFFDIPKGKSNSSAEKPQEIVQFDIAYRYLKIDGTGNALDTYSYTDPSTGQKINGVFTDWNIVQSTPKQKIYDTATQSYIWTNPSVADGNEININQVDIPIQKGEKVQIKIRSISEAGWPQNGIKSDWSATVIVEFPANLESSDQISNILVGAQSEETAIKLEETLASTGVISHLSDNIPNPNQGDGNYFKHQSSNLAFNKKHKNLEGVVDSESTVDLQSYLDNAPSNIYVSVISNGVTYNTTLAKIIQVLVNSSSGTFNYETLTY